MSDDLLDHDDDGEMVEIDWEPLQGAVDAFRDAGLDLSDNRSLLDHWGALLGALLRKVHAEEGLEEEEVAELAAETAAFGIDLAFGPDELPEFSAGDKTQEN